MSGPRRLDEHAGSSGGSPDSNSNVPPGSPQRTWHVGAFLRRVLIGGKRKLSEPGVFHKVSLVALLAWVGLGADGLSSSAYGPEEAFKALGSHTYLAILLAVATAFTVSVIAYAYSRIIEHFPFGGGGYVVSTSVLGPKAGVVSGAALLVDYVLTISISIAAGADAVFSFLPLHWQSLLIFGLIPAKLLVEFAGIAVLVTLNLRGVRESVTILAPIFITFLVTHAILILGVIVSRAHEIPAVVTEIHHGFTQGLQAPPVGLGLAGMIALFLRAYSMGGGTYTGIEAVSNGLMIMREPRVETGKRTMVLMAASLAATASGLIVAYLLAGAVPAAGKTMNAVLAGRFVESLGWLGPWAATAFVTITLFSEAMLLFVAAQAGVIDGPRVMANMAHDSWLPHRFSQLSDRLTMQNGILLMGITSALTLLYTGGSVTHLVVMYSINVFLTFSLTELSMCRFWIRDRARHARWKKHISIHVIGLILCVSILSITIYEKFGEGGWVTLVLTIALIGVCALVRRHYAKVGRQLKVLDDVLQDVPTASDRPIPALDPTAPTAVLLVGSYAGLGVHSLLSIRHQFGDHFHNLIFISVGVIDSASFKGADAVEQVQTHTESTLRQYVALARGFGLAADYRVAVGTEAVAAAEEACLTIAKEYPKSVFFAGKLVFAEERWYQRLLHNETARQLQRRLQSAGLYAMILPVRVRP
ncbi:MAG: APC family permease [Candidatus Zixiibacteriota bacterium]